MSKRYIDAEALKQYISNCNAAIFTNKGYLIDLQAVLTTIDIMPDVSSTLNSNNTLDIKYWKRKLHRNRESLKRLKDNEENLSKWGQHDLGYFRGMVTVVEDLFDELGIEVEE